MGNMDSPTSNDNANYKMITDLSIDTPKFKSSKRSVSRIKGRVLFLAEPFRQTQAPLINWLVFFRYIVYHEIIDRHIFMRIRMWIILNDYKIDCVLSRHVLPPVYILPRVDNGEESIELPYSASKMIA